ncbi:hypothetical protein I312_100895 [Cryptococcus bacillisporus CA1280]|uniref:Arf-GAP domain-containing protein n=1 Tax=Cryptococcus bacillisporus CA1280 TaxID=1296109 RepID=A0A0D0VJX0_CRYGA|nr:hypothetical protein I312_05532 [Cryptococcus bacillisporus CA1280]
MEQRNERMLEELLKLPGNDNCADCHAPAPRWASVNLGIFLCVGCASVHRKMGTHKSRVKSVTLDTWTRDQIVGIKNMGNKASNAIYNPNEALHPPPPSYGHDERDSEIEKYIRKKYEQGAFCGGAAARLDGRVEPTSLNRARERDGRLPAGSAGLHLGKGNNRNPELNDVIAVNVKRERDLPPLPTSASTQPVFGKNPPRGRPVKSPSSQGISSVVPVWNTVVNGSGSTSMSTQQKVPVANLIDMSNSANSSLPLQVNMSAPATGVSPSIAHGQSQFLTAQPQSWGSTFSTSTSNNMIMNGGNFSASSQMANSLQSPAFAQQMSFSPQPPFGQHISPQPTYHQPTVPMASPSFQQTQQFATPPSFQQQLSPQFTQPQQFLQYPMQYNGQVATSPMNMGMGMSTGMAQPTQAYGYFNHM